eukprot:1898771-Pleurochrysis_carterae.AAC.1
MSGTEGQSSFRGGCGAVVCGSAGDGGAGGDDGGEGKVRSIKSGGVESRALGAGRHPAEGGRGARAPGAGG